MPKLSNVDEKYVNGYKVDKENDDVIYSDEQHIYIDKNDYKPYVSVTTLIKKYENEFNGDFWASYKACEALSDPSMFSIAKQNLLATKKWDKRILAMLNIEEEDFNSKKAEILETYDVERTKACARGTAIHAKFEEQFYTAEEQSVDKYGLGGKFICKKGHYKLDLERGVYPEFLLSWKDSDGCLRVSGQVDLLIKDGNEITIVDYKTNKKIDKESYYNRSTKSREMMKFPLNDIMDSNYWHYCLQLSTYAYLLKKLCPEFVIKKLIIVHIDHSDNITEYECEYLESAVERMLSHYKKHTKIQSQLDLDKPIIF